MEILLIVIMLVIALDIASLRWGVDSTEQIDSPEWERRVAWRLSEDSDTSRRERDVK